MSQCQCNLADCHYTGNTATAERLQIRAQTDTKILIGGEIGNWYRMGTKQGDPISPLTLRTHLENAIDKIKN